MSHALPANPSLPAHHQTTTKRYLPAPTNQKSAQLLPTCTWATEYPELQKACFLARVCEERAPRYCQLHNVSAILQEGPTCGLTALSMLVGGTPTAHELLQVAKELRYTNNGEMFSAHNFFQLICDTLKSANVTATHTIITTTPKTFAKECKNASTAAECELHEGLLDCAKVRAALETGACIFVPYPLQ